jgi:hypothetical protein
MLFAVFFTPRPGTDAAERARLSREWPFPQGLRSVAWYHFPESELRWLEMVEAEDVAVLMQLVRAYDAFYEIKIFPAESGTRA